MKNSSNRNIVSKNDYEHYIFPIPINVVLKRRRKNFIWSELEKRQPCFCDDYCFDYKLRFNRHGVFSDVVVMKKMKLLDYKKKAFIPAFGVRFENNWFLPRFVNKRVHFVLIGLVIMAIVLFIWIYRVNKNSVKQANAEFQKEMQLEKADKTVLTYSAAEKKIPFSVIRQKLKANEGVLQHLELQTNGYKESLLLEVQGVMPEILMGCAGIADEEKVSNVKFEEKNPHLVYSYSMQKSKTKEMLQNREQSETSDRPQSETSDGTSKAGKLQKSDGVVKIFSGIRKLVFGHQQKLLEENWNTKEVVFTSAYDEKLLSEIGGLFSEINFAVVRLDCAISNNDLTVKLCFSEQLQNKEGISISEASFFLPLFFKDKKQKISQVEITQNKKQMDKTKYDTHHESKKQKIGVINHADGREIIYYRGETGKLIREEIKK